MKDASPHELPGPGSIVCSRRSLLVAMTAVPACAATTVLNTSGMPNAKAATDAAPSYRLTAHVRTYYDAARF